MTLLHKKTVFFLLSVFFGILFFQGCGGEGESPVPVPGPPDAKKKVVKKAEKPDVKKETIQEEEKVLYAYDPSGKKDPFFPFVSQVTVALEDEGEDEVPLTELQQYELSQLKLVAVMKLKGRNIAMVEDPQGKGHTIYVGTWIGKNKGKVAGIEPGKVLVEERFRDLAGKINTEIKELVIDAAEGGIR